MRLFQNAATLTGLFGVAFALDNDFNPIKKPTEGEVIKAGNVFTIEWEPSPHDMSSLIDIELFNNESKGQGGYVECINCLSEEKDGKNVHSQAGKYEWKVAGEPGFLELWDSDSYFLRLLSHKNNSVFNDSPLFSLKGFNKTAASFTTADTSHTSSATPSPTELAAYTTTLAAPSDPTNTGGATKQFNSAPVALYGALFAGVLLF